MKISESEDLLFEKWSKTKNGFVTDGIINEDEWNKSNPKILFILKEANDTDGGGWDLREFISQGGRPHTWDNIARWTYGIKNLDRVILWDEIREISEDFRRKCLQSICVVNLKKYPGGHTTNNSDLAKESESDKQFLIEQFNLYSQSDIIICCGTIVLKLFHSNVNNFPDFEWKTSSKGINYHQIGENKYLFEYLHPEVRVGKFNNILFYGLIDSIKEVYQCTNQQLRI